MSVAYILTFVLALVWGTISVLGILYPFRPFRTRKRAFMSVLACLALVIGSTVGLAITQPETPLQTAEEQQPVTPPAATAEAPAAPAVATTPPPSATTADTAPAEPPAARAPAIDKFKEADFYWDADAAKYKKQIVAVVNRIARENANCPQPDLSSVTLSKERSKPNDPVFFVMCGSGAEVFNVWFSPKDAGESEKFTATEPITQGAATQACEDAAKAAAKHPSTVDFSRVIDLSFKTYQSGAARLVSSFTAKNSFGLELTYDIQCFFRGKDLVEKTITERK